MIEINAVTSLQEHQIGDGLKDRALFFFGRLGSFLRVFAICDVGGHTAQTYHLAVAVEDRAEIGFNPNEHPVIPAPAKLREAIATAGDGLVAFLQHAVAILVMRYSPAEAGRLRQP